MEIKQSTFWMIMIIVVLAISGYFLIGGSSMESSISGAVISNGVSGNSIVNSEGVQIVKFHVEGANYVFEPSSVKKGTLVRLEADISRMPGCSRSIVSSELGISKTFSANDNTYEFMPNKAGQFYVACSMNMYKGILTVLESDGAKANYVQAAPASGGSCGANGGGCGCGG